MAPPQTQPGSPVVSVVMPVFDRPRELRRALESLVRQTFGDFECLVVDDASPTPLETVVSGVGDPRMRYVRTPANLGPYGARLHGSRLARGRFVFALDSDDEAFPWALDRAVHFLAAAPPEVGGVAGLCLYDTDRRVAVRLRAATKLVTPDEYRRSPPVPDCAGMFRREVVQEWLRKRQDYYALESHQLLTFGLRHSQLYVDEPWKLVHQGSDRVSGGQDRRALDDYLRFVDEHASLLGEPAVVIDAILEHGMVALLRAGRLRDARLLAGLLHERGRSPASVLGRRLLAKAAHRLPERLRSAPRPHLV